jgi:hypothetical protein
MLKKIDESPERDLPLCGMDRSGSVYRKYGAMFSERIEDVELFTYPRIEITKFTETRLKDETHEIRIEVRVSDTHEERAAEWARSHPEHAAIRRWKTVPVAEIRCGSGGVYDNHKILRESETGPRGHFALTFQQRGSYRSERDAAIMVEYAAATDFNREDTGRNMQCIELPTP